MFDAGEEPWGDDPLFEPFAGGPHELELTDVIPSTGVTHLRYAPRPT